MSDYRAKFKEHYGITFGRNYDVHHIDLNHENDEIDNLLLLPKHVHNRYHFCLNACGMSDGWANVSFSAKLDSHTPPTYSIEMPKRLAESIEECAFWIECKDMGYANPDGTKMIFS